MRTRAAILAVGLIAAITLLPARKAYATVYTPWWAYGLGLAWIGSAGVGVATDIAIPFSLRGGVSRGVSVTGTACWSFHTLVAGSVFMASVNRRGLGRRMDGGPAAYLAFSVGSLVLSAYAIGRPPEAEGVRSEPTLLPGPSGPVPGLALSARW